MEKLAALLTASLLATTAIAEVPADVARIEVVPGWSMPDGTYMAGLRISLADGWKTYWRAPGDAGIPPEFNWQGAENIATASFHWPTPEVIISNGMQTIGYHGSIVLPVELGAASDGPMRIKGTVDMGVCQDICMPVQLSFDTLVDRSGGPNAVITSALIDQPMPAERAQVGKVTCSVEPIRYGLRLTAQIDMPTAGENEVVVIEAPDAWVSESVSHREAGSLFATVDVVPMVAAYALDRSLIRMTVLGTQRAVDIRGCTG